MADPTTDYDLAVRLVHERLNAGDKALTTVFNILVDTWEHSPEYMAAKICSELQDIGALVDPDAAPHPLWR